MNRKGWITTALLLLALLCAGAGVAQDEALTSLRAEREAAEARDRERLAALLEDQAALEQALAEAREAHAEAEARHATLTERQAQQDAWQAALAERQGEQGGELTALLATLARHTSELRDALSDSWLALEAGALPPRLDDVEVLERHHLEELADSLMALTAQSARVEHFTAPVVGHDGRVTTQPVVRVGAEAAFTAEDLLRRGSEAGTLAVVAQTPAPVAETLGAFVNGESRRLALDPTGGAVIAALAQQPTLLERFHQGGAVGYVVVGLGGFGLLVALGQYLYLLRVSLGVRRQRRDLTRLRDDNPLGRVLGRFRTLQAGTPPEALEARLDEAVLAEQPRLERGQPLVKLLAAVAPLLGLLGTVTGMIVTFQAITVFGTGDPQLMAGGISQALVTTVLGLITAVPLLFAHTALAARSRHLAGIVDGEASAALADHLEQRSGVPAPRAAATARTPRDPALA